MSSTGGIPTSSTISRTGSAGQRARPIVRALELRRAAGLRPFTVLCCDNLPANGETTARVVHRLRRAAAIRRWPTTSPRESPFHRRWSTGSFRRPPMPIVTLVAADDGLRRCLAGRDRALHAMGHRGSLSRAAARPWSRRRAACRRRRPFELMKLRMLNGSHSTIAYLGYLAGYAYVNEAIADPAIRTLIHGFMTDEVMETLPSGLRRSRRLSRRAARAVRAIRR